MKFKRKKLVKKPRTNLESQVVREQTNDTVDRDILAHVEHFLKSPIPPLERISLASPESARSALTTLEQTHALLQERLRTARILKTLCEDAKANDNEREN